MPPTTVIYCMSPRGGNAAALNSQTSRPPMRMQADPVFVSDVTQPDVDVHLSYLRTSGDDACVNFADTIHSHLESGQLRIVTDPFWTTPLAMWECPATLLADMSQSALVITKGDGEYHTTKGPCFVRARCSPALSSPVDSLS